MYAADGVDLIVQSLESPMAQKVVYQKRRFLADYEALARYPADSLGSFSNRYGRVERNLEAVCIQVTAMYDEER